MIFIIYSTNTGEITHVRDFQYVIKGSIVKDQKFCFDSKYLPFEEYEVEAETEEQARKIFQDRYAQAKYEYLMDEAAELKKKIDNNE